MSLPLSPPELLGDDHQTERFDSGESALDDWLRRRARANQASGASRTYVVCDGITRLFRAPSLRRLFREVSGRTPLADARGSAIP